MSDGVNEPALRQAFCRRGILRGVDCQLALPVKWDSFLNRQFSNRNEGANPYLFLTEDGSAQGLKLRESRAVIGFDLAGVDPARIQSAELVLQVAWSTKGWGSAGRTVDAHPLLADFSEGNGRVQGVAKVDSALGEGPGVTWNCAVDPFIEAPQQNCQSRWNGGLFGPATAAPAIQANGQIGQVAWDVTADVQAGASAWLIKKTREDEGGRVKYYAREGAAAAGDMTLAPRLLITFAAPR